MIKFIGGLQLQRNIHARWMSYWPSLLQIISIILY
jgi:hypothetical protein